MKYASGPGPGSIGIVVGGSSVQEIKNKDKTNKARLIFSNCLPRLARAVEISVYKISH